MKKQLKQVSPEDFDVRMLMQAAREGRLYFEEKEKTVSREYIINNVRAYVDKINVFVTRPYRSSIDDLWNEILSCDEFIDFLTPSSKTRKCQEFNKYNVMSIIGVLREKDVYERYSDYKFNAILEQTDKDTPYRKYLGRGLDERHLLVKLRKIVAEIQL